MSNHIAFALSFGPMIRRSRAGMALLVFLLAGGAAVAQQYVISTYAGGAPPPTPIAAVKSSFGIPLGVTTDAAGNVYFSSNLHCVFKLDANGTLTRVAGNSRPGYSGDGGPATDAQLLIPDYEEYGVPGGLAMDGLGNLYIADFGNNRIRRVSPDGIITTVAGSGASGYSGDSGPAVDAQLNSPQGVALDNAGNLYIADTDNNRVRKVSLAGIITTMAGNGAVCCSGETLGDGGPATNAQLDRPSSLAIDSDGNLFIAGFWGSRPRVRKVSPDGIITTVAGSTYGYSGDGGPATSAQHAGPMGLAVDSTGNLYILDAGNSRVRKVSPDGIINTAAGNGSPGYSGDGGPASGAQITQNWIMYGLAVDAGGNLYFGDGYRVRKVSADGIITTAAGSGSSYHSFIEGTTATSAQLNYPHKLAADSSGNLYIVGDYRVLKVSPNGIISTVAGNGVRGSLGDGGPATSAQLGYPHALAVDCAGNLYISGDDHRVRRVSPNGIISTVAGNGTGGSLGDGGPATSAQLSPGGLAADSAGNLYIANEAYYNPATDGFEADYRVRKVSPAGIITTVAGNGTPGYSGDGGLATSAQLYTGPLAVDSAGDLYLLGGGVVRKVSSDGIINTVAGGGTSGHSGDGDPAPSAQLNCTSSLAVDSAGSMYITDYCESLIRRVSAAGAITAVAGNGTGGYSGDGGPAISAQISSPAAYGSMGVAVDGAGNLYIADSRNAAVRILRPASRSVLIGAVVDAASQRADPVSPGKIVVIYGASLGPSQLIQNQPRNGQLGTELAGVTVSFNGIPAPVLYASATQIAAVVPYAITGTTVRVAVANQGEASEEFTIPMASAAPSLFTLNQTGAGHAAAVNAANGTVNTAANPARIGAYISLYATGEGQTAPAGVDGRIAGSTPSRQVLPVKVTVGGIPAAIQYAGGAPGLVAGVMQVNVQIPSGVQAGGYVPVIVQVGDRASSPAVWIAVAN